MKTFHVTLLMLALVVAGTLTSCTIEEDLVENSTYATGGELDDPVEPDRDDE